MNPEPIWLGVGVAIGLPLGLLIGFLIRRRRSKRLADESMRDLKTRLTSLQLRLEHSQNELAASKAVVANLLRERPQNRDYERQASEHQPALTVVLDDTDAHLLSKVRGIGPKLAVTLASYGITDLQRLAEVTEQELSRIEANAPTLAERMTRERWKEQAIQLLHDPDSGADGYPRLEEPETAAGADQYTWAKFGGEGQDQALNGSSS